MEVDALIVGAGPSGSVTALNLAPFHRVLMIDRQPAPWPRIGESLPGAARRLLVDMGLWEAFLGDDHAPCHVHRSLWGGSEPVERDALRDPDGFGWHLDRTRFETRLRDTATTRGVGLLAPARLLELGRDHAGWRVALDVDGRRLGVRTRSLIDATGRGCRLLRKIGQRWRAESRLVCTWVISTKAALPRGVTQVEAEPEGWWYAAPIPGGGGVLAFHTDTDLPAARSTRTVDQLLARAKGLRMLGEFAAPERWAASNAGFCAAHGGYLANPAGPSWIAVGDAAQSYDPLASRGLFNALYTGLAAAEAAGSALSGDARALSHYASELREVRAIYKDHLAAWYGLEQRWPDSTFWRRRHDMPSRLAPSRSVR